MELRQLETFRAVAEELSFSRAAARLGYVQSSVSSQVGALERELGVPLFDRMGRRIALTEAGRVMLGYSESMLGLVEEARKATADAGTASGEVVGSLTASSPETLLTYRLPKLLAFFYERYPKAKISVRPSAIGKLTGEARRAVEAGKVDVAFVLDEPAAGGSGLSVETLVEEDVSVIAPTSHALASSPVVGPSDLRSETVLLPEAPESGCAYRTMFERQLARAGVLPSETVEFASIETVKRCVMVGMGVSVLPTVAVRADLMCGRLSALKWSEPFEVATQMAWHKGRWKSPVLKAFLEAAREIFASGSDEQNGP